MAERGQPLVVDRELALDQSAGDTRNDGGFGDGKARRVNRGADGALGLVMLMGCIARRRPIAHRRRCDVGLAGPMFVCFVQPLGRTGAGECEDDREDERGQANHRK